MDMLGIEYLGEIYLNIAVMLLPFLLVNGNL